MDPTHQVVPARIRRPDLRPQGGDFALTNREVRQVEGDDADVGGVSLFAAAGVADLAELRGRDEVDITMSLSEADSRDDRSSDHRPGSLRAVDILEVMGKYDHLVGFFDAAILAVYRSQPEKYSVESDYFSGALSTSDRHFAEFAQHQQENSISLRFGFRSRHNGELVLAVWMNDFKNCSADESARWDGFAVDPASLIAESDDTRYRMWVQRYLDGNWYVEDGVIARLRTLVGELNALTLGTVDRLLFKSEELEGLQFPTSQNSHRYQDAHAEAYKLLVDGLEKDCLIDLASRLNIPLKNPSNSKTLKLLRDVLPPQLHDCIFPALEVVSENRRLSAHQARLPAEKVDAFELFNRDMARVGGSLERIRDHFATSLAVTVNSCVRRKEALAMQREFDDTQLETNYSIWGIEKVKGKTISDVRVGWRKRTPAAHDSEMIMLFFDDGSSMSLTTGSNFRNICQQAPSALEVSFDLHFVPPVEKID